MLLLFAVMKTVEFIGDKEKKTKNLSSAIVYFLLGGAVLAIRDEAEILIGAVWGTLGLYRGSESLARYLDALIHKRGRKITAILMLAESLIGIGISILLLTDPPEHLHAHVVILGIKLLESALRNGVELYAEKKQSAG
ncbi:MAG: hypothetical protein IKP75_03200 [Oscillospiraceae bacterium]|nr:hypothetical protein [Oscillospiraceae bacterium]